MSPARRLAVLSLLGIEQWVPRTRVAEFQAAQDARPASPSPVPPAGEAAPGVAANTTPSTAPAVAPAIVPTTVPPRVSSADMPVMPPPGLRETTSSPAVPVTAATAPAAAGGDTLLLGVARLPHGVLMLASAQLPGLSGAQHALLARMGAALAGTPPTVEEFAWPPPGTRIPGADRPGEADRALALRLNEEQARGLAAVVLAGSDEEQRVARLLGDAVPLVVVPSLAEMLADPAHKRAAWDAMRHLARPA